MNIKKYLLDSYPTTNQYSGINSIENILYKNKYLVLTDNDNEFKGILTPCDLIRRPRKIAIDCVTEKESISSKENILSVLDKFSRTQVPALPVFEKNKFIGVVDRHELVKKSKLKIDEIYKKSLISEKVKQAFIDNISHEVRTPLNGILGFLEIISKLNPEDFNSKGQLSCNVIRKCTDKFLITMNDLIDLALIHAGEEIETEISKFYIADIFSELKEYFVTEASLLNRDISISYDVSNKVLPIISDQNKIKHILYHLIDNGIKFSYNNKVHYSCTRDKEKITFSITNEGPKIGDNIKDKIFNYFEKPDVLNTGFIDGLGIGLPLVNKLTTLLDGNLHFESANNFTTFYCTIPLLKQAPESS